MTPELATTIAVIGAVISVLGWWSNRRSFESQIASRNIADSIALKNEYKKLSDELRAEFKRERRYLLNIIKTLLGQMKTANIAPCLPSDFDLSQLEPVISESQEG